MTSTRKGSSIAFVPTFVEQPIDVDLASQYALVTQVRWSGLIDRIEPLRAALYINLGVSEVNLEATASPTYLLAGLKDFYTALKFEACTDLSASYEVARAHVPNAGAPGLSEKNLKRMSELVDGLMDFEVPVAKELADRFADQAGLLALTAGRQPFITGTDDGGLSIEIRLSDNTELIAEVDPLGGTEAYLYKNREELTRLPVASVDGLFIQTLRAL